MEPTRVLRELTGSSDGMMPESERHCVGQTIPVEPGVHAGRAKEGRPSLASLPRKEERQVRLITVPGGAGKRARDLEQGKALSALQPAALASSHHLYMVMSIP